MKNIFITFCMLILSIQILSQKQNRLFITLQSGVNFSKYHLNKNDGNIAFSSNFKNVTSFNFGANVNYKINRCLLLQSGLNLEGRGSFTDSYGIWVYEHSTTHTYHVTLPINLLYDKKIRNHFSIFIGSGISTSLGLFGTNIYNGSSGDLVYNPFKGKDNIQFGKSSDNSLAIYSNLKQFDLGINILGGVTFKKISLKCQYVFGIRDVSMQPDNRGKNRTLSFTVGYKIKKLFKSEHYHSQGRKKRL